MNQVTTLYNYIKSLGEADEYVNTITKNATSKILQDKVTIFPLLNIEITNIVYTSPQTKQFTLNIACFNQRVKYNDSDKWDTDNEVDNMNETEACLNRIWLNSERNFQDNNITANDSPTLTPILEGTTALVDGWEMTVDIVVPNIDICL